MTPPTLDDDIRRRLGECPPAERKVARVLLAGYPSVGFETVARIAERADVSAPTVIRFVNRLGYRGFPDFQQALRDELGERNASPLTRYATGAFDGGTAGAASVFGAALQHTLDELPPHDLERAVELLADRRNRITLTGGRYSHLLARYLGLYLMQMRPEVRFLPDRDVERTAVLANLGRKDVLVLFDYRRYEPDSSVIAKRFAESGGQIVLFTDTWLSPISGRAAVVLPCRVTTVSPFDSLVPTMAVVETVVAAVVAHLGADAHNRMHRFEETARSIGVLTDPSHPQE